MDISSLTESHYTIDLGESLYSLLSGLVNRVAALVIEAFSSPLEVEPPPTLEKKEDSKGEFIGLGGSAIVYRVGDRALKRFHTDISKAGGVEMAKYELMISRKLENSRASGFVAIHGIGHDERSAWIDMDFVPGTTLGESDPKSTPKPPKPYIAQLCTSIRFALKAGLLPWDLNKGNLILNKDGVTIVDFGLYKIFGQREGLFSPKPADYYRHYTDQVKNLFLFAHKQNEGTPEDLVTDLLEEIKKTQASLQGMEMGQEGLKALDAGLRRIVNLSAFYS